MLQLYLNVIIKISIIWHNDWHMYVKKGNKCYKLEVLREHRPPPNASIIELLNKFCNAN